MCGFSFQTHIITLEVWMVLLDSVIQYGHHHTLSRNTLLPGFLHIEVTVVAIVLKRRRHCII